MSVSSSGAKMSQTVVLLSGESRGRLASQESSRLSTLLSEVQHRVVKDLEECRLQVHPQKRQIVSTRDIGTIEQEKMSELQRIKKEIQGKLRDAEWEEEAQLRKMVGMRHPPRKRQEFVINPQLHRHQRIKSEMTLEDVRRIRKILKEAEGHEMKLKQKTEEYGMQLERIKIEERQLTDSLLKQASIKHREAIIKRQAEVKQNRQMLSSKFEAERKALAAVRMKPKLHEQLDRKYQESEREISQEKYRQMLKRVRSKNTMVDVRLLKTHENQYIETLRLQRLERKEKFKEISQTVAEIAQKEYKTLEKSKYYETVEQEIQIQKKKELEQKSKKFNFDSRVKKFIQKLRQQHPIVQREKRTLEDSEQHKRKSLSKDQVREVGDKYLKYAVDKRDRRKKDLSEAATSDRPETICTSPDYLRQFRQRRTERKEDKFQKIKQRIESILRSQLGGSDRVEELKSMASRLERPGQEVTSQDLIKKISIKLRILECS